MEQGIRASKIEELLIDGNPILDGDSHHANESLLRLASLMPNLTSFGFRIDNIDEGVVPNYKLQSFLDCSAFLVLYVKVNVSSYSRAYGTFFWQEAGG